MHIRAGQAHAKRWNDGLKTGLTPLSLSAEALGSISYIRPCGVLCSILQVQTNHQS